MIIYPEPNEYEVEIVLGSTQPIFDDEKVILNNPASHETILKSKKSFTFEGKLVSKFRWKALGGKGLGTYSSELSIGDIVAFQMGRRYGSKSKILINNEEIGIVDHTDLRKEREFHVSIEGLNYHLIIEDVLDIQGNISNNIPNQEVFIKWCVNAAYEDLWLREIEINTSQTQNKILLLSEKEKVKSIFDSKYLENAIPEMISNLEPYGRVRASSNENIAYCAFNNTTDHWVGDTDNEWIEYEFNKPIIIKELSLIAPSSGYGRYWMRGIKNFSLCVSNNGKNYFTVFEGEHPNTNSEVSYEIENDKAWKYIRVYITSVYHNTAATKQVRVRKIGISGKTPMSTLETDDLSKRSFISYGMSLEEISNIKFSQKFTEKHYIQSKSTPLGSGKVFEQPLDVDKIIKSVKIT